MRQRSQTFSKANAVPIVSAAIQKAKRHIEEHFTEQLSSRGLAHLVGFSAEHFCRTFRQETGSRFTDYVARKRVEKVCETLLQTNQAISHIALECGFRSLAQFNRTFKRAVKVTPSEFRTASRG